MAAEQKEATQTKTSSKQLLYAEKFGGTLLERKLQIVGNKKERLTKPCLPPPSSVLSRVKTLLPKLQAANEKLRNIPQKDVAIEISDTESDGPAIEMNLALMPSIDSCSSEEEEESDEDEKGEEDSDEDSDKKDSNNEDGPSISELLAPSNNQGNSRKRKLVEVLDKEDENDDSDERKDDGKE